MPNSKKIIELAPGSLLENSVEEQIVTAANWNTVMSNIKYAINNHAKAIAASETRTVSGLINLAGSPIAPYWEPSTEALYWNDNLPQADEYLYSTIIPQTAHEFPTDSDIIVQLFNEKGESIDGGVYIQPNLDVIILSRKNISLKFVIRGGN
jgi:hypothetical protein